MMTNPTRWLWYPFLPLKRSKAGQSDPEYRALDDAYRFLRKTEHRLQLLFDWQTHRLPEQPEEMRKLALRMGGRTCPVDERERRQEAGHSKKPVGRCRKLEHGRISLGPPQ